MKKLIALLGAVALHAAAASLPPETPLVTEGSVKVDVRDLDAFMLRIPENMRAPFRASYDRVASAVDSLFITRVAAEKAREAGLDKDPTVQRRLQQIQEGFLADLYVQKLQAEVDSLNLEQRARELYQADPRKFTSPEAVYVQQILVGLNGRTRDMARERAQQAYNEAAEGKQDFLQLAAKYSDDPDKVRNGGDLGYYSPSHFSGPRADAIAKLDKKGQLAGPIEAPEGFYIVRFVDRTAPKLATFEAVREKLIAEERERLKKDKMEEFMQQVRSSKSVVINTANVESYVVRPDADGAKKEPEKKK